MCKVVHFNGPGVRLGEKGLRIRANWAATASGKLASLEEASMKRLFLYSVRTIDCRLFARLLGVAALLATNMTREARGDVITLRSLPSKRCRPRILCTPTMERMPVLVPWVEASRFF